MSLKGLQYKSTLSTLGALGILVLVYLFTLQTIPNGSSHYYMIDVGETQIVLNTWGSLHATGYPLYAMSGSALVTLLKTLGIGAVVAPAVVSLLWGIGALALLSLLARHITRRDWLPALVILPYGLTRTIWIHNIIAEIYSFGLVILLVLLLLALWENPIPNRIYWLALIGGIGVAHHRAIAMSIPALLYATAPVFLDKTNRRRLPRIVGVSLLLGLVGFTQYAYMYWRGQTGAAWVYGDPGTLGGLWHEFMGKEAARFIGSPGSLDGLIDNFHMVNAVILRDLTAPGVIAGLAGLTLALWNPVRRRAAGVFWLNGLAAYLFHVGFYTDTLSALILPITLSLAFGWLFLADKILQMLKKQHYPVTFRQGYAIISAVFAFTAGVLFVWNNAFIRDITTDETGLEVIEQVRAVPPGSTVMIGWGPRYFAPAFAHDVQNDLQHVILVDHNADFAAIVESGRLVTPEYTFYHQPVDWWQTRLGTTVYLYAAAPGMVEISTRPDLAQTAIPEGITVAEEAVSCEGERVVLDITWQTDRNARDALSVFVHALDSQGGIVAQADQLHPVYGWRPVTTWLPGERVRDIYLIETETPEHIRSIRYGMYLVLPDGGFKNTYESTIAVLCPAAK